MVNPADLERAIKIIKVALARLDGATFSYSTTVGEKSGEFDKVRGELCEALNLLKPEKPKPELEPECEHDWWYTKIGMNVSYLECKNCNAEKRECG